MRLIAVRHFLNESASEWLLFTILYLKLSSFEDGAEMRPWQKLQIANVESFIMASDRRDFRQLCDKPNSCEITSTSWSSTSDLVAALTDDGEVRLHRLYWGKVWSYSDKDSKVVVIAWSPSGKVLAVGSDSGIIRLLEIEKCNLLHTTDTGSPVTSLEWKETVEVNMSILLAGHENGSIKLYVNGLFNVMSINQVDELQNAGGRVVSLFLPKSLKCLASVHSHEEQGSTRPSRSFKLYQLELMSSRTKEVKMLAVKYEKINSLLQKLDDDLTQISESWENNLQKVSLKLDKLAEILPADTSVLEEFLMAYACGTLSPELQSFLINELTMKGLRKLGSDINSSYGGLKNRVVDNLQALCYDISVELSELLGMARWYEKFGILGLSENDIQDSLNYLGTFILKIKELLSVIEEDLRSFRAFFKWLSGVMYRISDEPIPNVFKEFSQEEHAHILGFLQTQLVKGEDQKSFVLERIGHYLKEEEEFSTEILKKRFEIATIDKFLLDLKNNDRVNNFKPSGGNLSLPTAYLSYDQLKEREKSFRLTATYHSDNPIIIAPEKEKSLTIIGKRLHAKVTQVFDRVAMTMAESFTSKEGPTIMSENDDHEEQCCPKVSWIERQADNFLAAFVLPCSCNTNYFFVVTLSEQIPPGFAMSKLCIDLATITNQERDDVYRTVIKDVNFYNDDYVTLLVTESENCDTSPVSVLAQLDTAGLRSVSEHQALEKSTVVTNISQYLSKWRCIESFDPLSFSVNGSRKVACLLSTNRRRIRIYDMDAEEEEEEDGDLTEDESQLEEI